MFKTISIEQSAGGVAIARLNVTDRSMNVLTPELIDDLQRLAEWVRKEASVKGLVITSAKAEFVAGADLKELLSLMQQGLTPRRGYEMSQRLSTVFRNIETVGKPVAAAINGLALGGGLELALACHRRFLSSDPKAVVGLPEVKVGLLPGAGGTQRVLRLIGLAAAARLITDGAQHAPEAALKLGLVHEVVPPAELVDRAAAWVESAPAVAVPWDVKGFRIPGGSNLTSATVSQTLSVGTALITKNAGRNYPAAGEILSALYEGGNVPFDLALKIESKHFARLLTSPVAHNLIRTLFVNKGELDKGARRPADIPVTKLQTIGILGAGMMGAGIAHVAARSGLRVILLDATIEQAERGRAHTQTALDKEIARGRMDATKASGILSLIESTTDYSLLENCDLIIEAVFEDRRIKADVTAKAAAVIGRETVFASNTSTLPISGLAQACPRPQRFIGIHFFSPVEKMPLVEIILGRKTSKSALAAAMDLCARLRKTPIVVHDGRGFFTSRVFGSYCQEGQILLKEGVAPALIENGARQAGMPVGPLAVTDEVSLKLQYDVAEQTRQDLGDRYQASPAQAVLERMVVGLRRLGRKSGGGFYEYPSSGAKSLWTGLTQEFPLRAEQPTVTEVQQRLLYIQALEAARSFEEGVVTTAEEADIGSILGIGFPAWTGGVLSYIDMIGLPKFVSDCERLARLHGRRFKPSRWLKLRAASGLLFHEKPPSAVATAANN